jgi:hypothetical protein
MQLTSLKTFIALAFIVAAGAFGILMPVTTFAGWMAVIGFGILPSVFMLRAWREPAQTNSERIQAEIRR